MIFKPHLCAKVLTGEKTQTRRPLKYSYTVGRRYAVQPGRGKHAVAHVVVTAVERVRVLEISHEDVKAEGFESRGEFLGLWCAMYREGEPECWKLTFELVQ